MTEVSPSVDMHELEKAKQGKVTGVIIPPPEVRAVVDKTAQFVARNGKSFEQRILSSGEGKTAKFNFMKPYDPYHAYYEMKIRDFEEGKPTTTPTAPNGTAPPVTPAAVVEKPVSQQIETTAAKATFTTPLARFAMNKPKEAPPPFEFSLGHPSGLSSLDIDVMKITAQYTALNGREFLSGLAQREARNPQFDFLKPTHMLFSYFTSLVDAYAKILQPSSSLLKAIKERSTRMGGLEKCVQRWGWERMESERKKQEAMQADAERSALQSIDWYDFVVVETIEFRDDELYEPAGLLSAGVGGAAGGVSTGRSSTTDVDEDMDMGDDSVHVPPPPPPPPAPTPSAGNITNRDMDEDMEDDRRDEEDDSDLNIVTDYKPRVGPTGLRSTKMVDPISGRAIPAEQMQEHMRIQLQDPRWRIEQQRFLDKQQDSGMTDSGSIASHLQQFARQRGDIFGSAEEEEARLLAEEGKRKKRVEETNRIIWDGHQSSLESVKRQRLEQPTSEPTSASGAGATASSSTSGFSMGMPPQPPLPSMASPAIPPPPPAMSVPAAAPPPPMHHMPPPHPPAPPGGMQSYGMATQQQHGSGMTFHSYDGQYSMMGTPGGAPPPPPPPPAAAPQGAPYMPGGLAGAPPVGGYNAPLASPSSAPSIAAEPALIPEDQFASRYSGPVTVHVQVPSTSPNPAWTLNGQTVSVTIGVKQTVKDLKDALGALVGDMPASKQQIKGKGGFLKDTQSLAFLNIEDGSHLEMTPKTRGGKR